MFFLFYMYFEWFQVYIYILSKWRIFHGLRQFPTNLEPILYYLKIALRKLKTTEHTVLVAVCSNL